MQTFLCRPLYADLSFSKLKVEFCHCQFFGTSPVLEKFSKTTDSNSEITLTSSFCTLGCSVSVAGVLNSFELAMCSLNISIYLELWCTQFFISSTVRLGFHPPVGEDRCKTRTQGTLPFLHHLLSLSPSYPHNRPTASLTFLFFQT